jgi:hypothetical protein
MHINVCSAICRHNLGCSDDLMNIFQNKLAHIEHETVKPTLLLLEYADTYISDGVNSSAVCGNQLCCFLEHISCSTAVPVSILI